MIATEIQMTGELLIDGAPVACPECGDTQDLTATSTRLPVPAWPAQVHCRAGHLFEPMTVTNGLITAVLASRTGRTRAADDDTFCTEVDGRLVEGTLYPVLMVDDIRQAARLLYRRGVKPQARREIRSAKRQIRGAVREITEAASLTPDQPDAEQEPTAARAPKKRAPRCPYCKGKGVHRLKTRIHDTTTVPCSLCSGTGDATEI
ncbi:hypothetical protein [Streptomyces sp. wa13]|uniref:hypothetical protein n=1 Tax=Streptomyces sp. wa13 TaxID=1828236 RepID=UPI003C7A34E1